MEIWKDVPTYEGYYQVSNLGRVKSLPRTVRNSFTSTRDIKGRILSQVKDKKSGYYYLNLSKENKVRIIHVHRIVAWAFLGHKGCMKKVIDHKNNNPSDNRSENLQITTRRINNTKDKKLGYKSKYLGVRYDKGSDSFRTDIRLNGVSIYLGASRTDQNYLRRLYQAALQNESKFDGDVVKFRNYIKNIV